MGFKGNFKRHKRSIHFAKEREMLCPVGGRARVSPSIVQDLGLDRTGDWDEGLTKTSSLTEECGGVFPPIILFRLTPECSGRPGNKEKKADQG